MISSISSGYSTATSGWSQMSRPDPSEMSKSLFSTTDTDGDGVITKSELSTALASKAQSNGTTGPDVDELFSALDADGDGSITEEEHETGLASLHKDLASQSWMTSMQMSARSATTESDSSAAMPTSDELFTSTDTNGDGSISLDELTTALSNRGDGNGPSAEELFATLDADGDGSITASEHSEGMAKMAQHNGPPMGPPPAEIESSDTSSSSDSSSVFSDIDTNGDGVISQSELAAAMSNSSSSLLEDFFNAFDTDSSGTVSESEINSVLNQQNQSLTSRLAQNAYTQYQYMNQDLQNLYAAGSFVTIA